MKKILFLTLFLLSTYIFSQQNISVGFKNTDLKSVILNLEDKSDYSFSYAEEVITNKKITLVKLNINIDQLLSELIKQTGLVFEKVSDSQVVISAPLNKIDICGYLFDKEFDTPLPFATIIVVGKGKGNVSDENGYFILENIGYQENIMIQYIGYTDELLNVSNFKNGECKNIYLHSTSQSLQEVIVSGYLTRGVDKNTDGSITLKNNELGIMPGLIEPDVFQNIQLIPGITSLNESASDIQIRGGSPDQNLIFYDNIKMYNTGHFFGMISNLNPYVVETSKIYKSGASPEYGDRISGVIDISSGEKIPKKFSGGIGLNGISGDFFIKSPVSEKVGVVFSARRSYTDLYKTPTFDVLSEKVFQNTKIVENSQGIITDDDEDEIIGRENFFFYDVNTKIIIQPTENDKLSISALYTKNELDFSLTDDDEIDSDIFNIENKGASFDWEGSKGKKWHYGLKSYYTDFYSYYENTLGEDTEIDEQTIRDNSVKDLGVDVNISYDLFSNHTIQIGYQYSNTDVFFQLFRNDFDDDDDVKGSRDYNVKRQNKNQTNVVYTEYQYKPKNKGLISLGVRGSHYSIVDEFFIEPRLNAEYPLSSMVRIKATAERRYQSITQLIEFEDTQLRLENKIWTLSDGADIPILESTQYSGGLLFTVNGWTLDIDGYIKSIKGLTSFTNGFINAAEELSQGTSDIMGVDVLLRKKLGDFRIWLGYTYNDIEYNFEELQTTPFPGNNDITHNFRISNTYEIKKWELSLGWNYRTGAPFTPIDSFNDTTGDIVYGSINSERLLDYHRLDASILYNFSFSSEGNSRGTFGASFQNIYARQIPISVFYRVDKDLITGDYELNQIRQLSLGFTPNVVLRFYF